MEVQRRERDKPAAIGAMQVELDDKEDRSTTAKPAPMHVQRRDRDKSDGFGNGVAYKVVETRSDDEISGMNPEAPDTQAPSVGRSWPEFVSSPGDFFANNPIRAFLVAAFFLSVLLLVLLSRQGGGSTLCDEAKPEVLTYPSVNFGRVHHLKDKARFAAVKAENWIVLCVTGAPTDEVRGMVKLQGWQVLAIGDTDTPADWLVPGAIFLSTDLQTTFRYRITSLLPYNSYVRKSIGYLFAIQHGAVRIYDADTHSTFLAGGHLGKSFDIELSPRKTLLQYKAKNRTLVNPFIHFGQRSVWPRGLSLTSVPDIAPEFYYDEVSGGNQFIQQGTGNGLPDVDSIFYHTRRLAGEPINIEFDHLAPEVALPRGTMAPVNSLNTLFHEQAFWAMMLPVTVHTAVSDVIRGYWAQRLLWDVGGIVAFYPPSVHRLDTLEGSTFGDEEDLLHDWGQLIDFLKSWHSSKSTFFERVLDLSYEMAKNGFWSGQDLALTVAWLQDLVSVGYKPPKLQPVENTIKGSRQFLPQILKPVYPGVTDAVSVEKEMGHLLKWRSSSANMVLILECDWARRSNIPVWRMLYGRLFKHVVVISTEADSTLGIDVGGGWQAYSSFPGIFDKYPEAAGFLYLKDHVVFNYWNMQGNNKKLWTMHEVKSSWTVHSFNETGTIWFLKSSIKRTVTKTIYNLPDKLKATYRETMDDTKFIHSSSDFFYIPKRLVDDFKDLASVGVQNKLAHELAMPLFFLAMDRPSQFDSRAFAKVAYVPGGEDPTSHYSIDLNVLYPWRAATEEDLFHIIKALSVGDHLLLAVL
ncbi:probable glycosyltransferase STELLO2 [Selaginella moellendorffii]|nr:probable glycosyltransferase STELLO2 [Selaginella moellendorffii]XP_024545540.1 probable glycosyltransferase STELLO2 [Selaginella moellendorffii]|eukprot:XP_002984603.2 probable glycosyltransferase STELLO2 [Selaginella moellendorffii]